MNSTFSMFSGKKQSVKLRFKNELINAVLDRFGKDIAIMVDDEEHFTVRVNVKPTTTFFGWLFQFGDKAEIVEPCEIKEKYIEQLKKVLSGYNIVTNDKVKLAPVYDMKDIAKLASNKPSLGEVLKKKNQNNE